MSNDKIFYATGRRKTSAARVFLSKGSGQITVNGKPAKDYFTLPKARINVEWPLQLTNRRNQYDLNITVRGGGASGQAEAIRHGVARALCIAEEDLRAPLKKDGLLRRDDRMVERKKYGHHKARKSTQFSKR